MQSDLPLRQLTVNAEFTDITMGRNSEPQLTAVTDSV